MNASHFSCITSLDISACNLSLIFYNISSTNSNRSSYFLLLLHQKQTSGTTYSVKWNTTSVNYRRLHKSVQQTIWLHVCACVHVSVFFCGGWGMWKELQNILQSTDMNNNSVYKFQSPSSQFKTLFPAQFSSSFTSLYVILSNFQNCYKILWKLITLAKGGGGYIYGEMNLHIMHSFHTPYTRNEWKSFSDNNPVPKNWHLCVSHKIQYTHLSYKIQLMYRLRQTCTFHYCLHGVSSFKKFNGRTFEYFH